MASLPPELLKSLERPTQEALKKLALPNQDVPQFINGPVLGSVPFFQAVAMPGAPDKRILKDVITTVLMDKLFLGAAIDARIAEALRSAPSSGGMTEAKVDAKIADALKAQDKRIADALKGVPTGAINSTNIDSKIAAAVKSTKENIGKMRLVSSGGGRTKRSGSKRGRGKKRGTKRR